jgi:hypothetical protein
MNTILNQVANDPSITGFGSMDAAKVDALQKALSIAQNYGTTAPGSLTGGSALAVEDLDRTLKLVTHGLEHLKLWKDIIKERVTQTVHEYNVQNSYGQEVSPFFSMGGTPQETDANYNREFVQVKYLGTQGQVQHNLTLIQAAHGPVIAREVKNKTIELLARNERSMFEANSAINSLEYDSVDAQIRSKSVDPQYISTAFVGYDLSGVTDQPIIDVRGDFDANIAERMALANVNNFGMAMDCYLGTDIHSVFSREYYLKQRTLPGETLTSGNRVKEHTGSLDFRFKPSLFNRPRISPLSQSVASEAAPTLASFDASSTDASSQFGSSDAGTYGYVLSLVYADGETVASSEASGSVAAGKIVKVTPSYTGVPLYANVFRSPKNGAGSNWQFIQRIALAGSGVAVTIDVNAYLPGAAKAYLLMHDPDALCWKQLGSMIKYDLAVTDTSYRWLQLLYGTPLVTAGRKHTIAQNLIPSQAFQS